MKVLYVDTEGQYSYDITRSATMKYLPAAEGIDVRIANHKKTEIHHISPFIPDWCLTSTPLNNHSYVIKRYRGWFSVGWDLEGMYEWKRLRTADSPNFDLIASVDPKAVDLLNSMGRKAFYLPLGFDPDVYRWQEVGEEYRSDVLVAGVMYGTRARWVHALKPISKNISIRTINCKHWESRIMDCRPWIRYYHEDKVPVEELVKYICGAKIVVIGHRDFELGNDLAVWGEHSLAIGRIFQETACRRLVLCDDTRPNVTEHFKPGHEIDVFSNEEELCKKILFYLNNDNARESIALRGYVRTTRENTYMHRIRTLVSKVKEVMEGNG
jgi:spore maturation protein CgeB